jgi:hypothetical protein
MGEQWNPCNKKAFFSIIKGAIFLSFSKETFSYLSFLFLKQEAKRWFLLFGNAQLNGPIA